MKQILKNYTFNTTAKTITLNDLTTVKLDRLQLITDVTIGVIIYNFASTAQFATISGNVITLSTLPGGVANTDNLQIIYDTQASDPSNDATVPFSIFRDPFNSMDTTKWVFTNKAASDLMYVGGNAASASWVSIVKSALVADTYSEIVSVNAYPVTLLASVGLTMSQRIFGQEFAYDFVGVDSSGAVISSSTVSDVAISNTGLVASGSILTYVTSAAHGLLPGDTVTIFGAADPRLNYGPVVVQSTPTATTFTILSSLGAATYQPGANAKVRYQPIDAFSTYIMSQRFVGNSHNNIDALTKSGDRLPQIVNWNPGNTATQEVYPTENGLSYSGVAYAYAQRTREEFVNWLSTKSAKFMLKDIDAVSATRGVIHRSHNIPDDTRKYKIRFRATNLASYTPPVGYITSISKSGTTTATVTVASHGLTTNDVVAIVGVRDQVNFTNNAATTIAVTSIVDSNNFTVVLGSAVTASSYGGMVMRTSQGGPAILPTTTSSAVQTYAKTTDGLRLSLVFLASQGTMLPGEIWTLYGLVDSTPTAQTALYGRYRVELSNTTTFTIELTPLDGQSLTGVSTTPANAGGMLIKNTELRLHYARVEAANGPQQVELIGASGDVDQSTAMPVNLNNQSVNMLVASSTAAGIATQASRNALGILPTAPVTNADRGSAAITVSGNSGVVATDFGASLSALINVTAVSGTSPTLDIVLQESFDNGTTFQDSYWLPRITATGTYPLPGMTINGRRRWNYIVGGTTPSITFSITTMSGGLATGIMRNFYDRAIGPNTLNSRTTVFNVEGCTGFELIADMGAITTTAPTFQLQGSENGTTWRNIGPPLIPTASAVTSVLANGYQPRFISAVVTSAGVGATLNALQIRGLPVSATSTTSVAVTSLPALPAGTNAIGSVKLLDTGGTNAASISAAGAVKVDNSAVTQPVSGTFWQATQPVSLATNTPTLQSGSTTAVTQPTAANLNATVVGTGTFATQSTLAPETTKVIGVTRTADGSGNLLTSTTGALDVNLKSTITQPVSGTFWQATQPVSLATNTPTLQSGSTTAVTQPTGANLHTVVDSGTVAATQSGTWTVQPGNTANTTPWNMNDIAVASGGYTPGKIISAASTNGTSVKTSAATLGYITASNINAAQRYLKVYNKNSSPTVGTDTPVHTFIIPGSTTGAGTNIPLPPQGIALSAGLAFAITTGYADNDTGSVAAGDIIINYGWI